MNSENRRTIKRENKCKQSKWINNWKQYKLNNSRRKTRKQRRTRSHWSSNVIWERSCWFRGKCNHNYNDKLWWGKRWNRFVFTGWGLIPRDPTWSLWETNRFAFKKGNNLSPNFYYRLNFLGFRLYLVDSAEI